MLNTRFYTLLGIIFAAATLRLLPHPPNFTPIAAMALFGGAHFAYKRAGFAVPLAAMLVSDVVLALTVYGFAAFSMMPFVYGSFLLIVCLGLWIRNRKTPLAIGGAALTGSVVFFLLTNLGVWLRGHLYPLTMDGLITCYGAAIPFFKNTLVDDAVYTTALFGGSALAQRYVEALRDAPTSV